MTVQYFLDTNILIYAANASPTEKAKKERAAKLITDIAFGLSAQVLAEFYANVTRKRGTPLPSTVALQWVELLSQQPCVPIGTALVKRGIVLSERYQISYWDGAIIAAAEALGATTLYSEDLSHGQLYGPVRAENPFIGL